MSLEPGEYFVALRNIDITNVYSYGSRIKNFGKFKMSAGRNIQDAAISGQLHIQSDFPCTEVFQIQDRFPFDKQCCVCVPFGIIYFPLTYTFYGINGGQEEVIFEQTFERNILDKGGQTYFEVVLGRILDNQGDNAIVYDEILASISIGEVTIEDENGNRHRVEGSGEYAMNGEFTMYGKYPDQIL